MGCGVAYDIREILECTDGDLFENHGLIFSLPANFNRLRSDVGCGGSRPRSLRPMIGTVLVFEPDLLFFSRIESAAARWGLEAKTAVTIEGLKRASQEHEPVALVANLDVFPSDGSTVIASFRGRCRLIGYYSHTDTRSALRGAASGFDEVLPRRTFMDRLNVILSNIGSS